MENKTPQAEKKEIVFKNLRDFEKEDFLSLEKHKVQLVKTVSKKGFVKCYLKLDVDSILLPISIEITEARFNRLRLELGLPIKDKMNREILSYDFNAPFRFVRGESKDGNEYESLEVILGQFLYHNYFFNDVDERNNLHALEKRGMKINWFVRPDAVDVTETVNWKSAE